jgi:hypothetical protein
MIVGRADDADVLRPEGFLGRNGHPRPAAELCALSSAGLRHKQAYASAGRDPGASTRCALRPVLQAWARTVRRWSRA